ncbi:MAG: diacylglycerol kinase family protein [Pseudomonadota bacterium]
MRARRRLLVVRNPLAGIAVSRVTAEVERHLRAAGADVAHLDTTGIDAMRTISSIAVEHDAVVAAGGDGTIRALAQAIAGTNVPLGIIPAGTGNVMANEIGVPASGAAIARMLIDGPVREIEGALANGAPFYLMAGAGLDGAIVSALDVALKQWLGRLAYAGPVLAALRRTPVPFRVLVDGTAHEAMWVVAANARHYAGRFVIAPHASLLRPGLYAVLLEARSRRALAQALTMVALGLHAAVKGLSILPATRIEVPDPQPLEADGDALGTAPLVVTAGGPRLRLIVPEPSHG